MNNTTEAIAPADVKRTRDVLQLNESTWQSRDYWMHVSHDGSISIYRHRAGEKATESVHIPRNVFQAMVRWYQQPQQYGAGVRNADGSITPAIACQQMAITIRAAARRAAGKANNGI